MMEMRLACSCPIFGPSAKLPLPEGKAQFFAQFFFFFLNWETDMFRANKQIKRQRSSTAVENNSFSECDTA